MTVNDVVNQPTSRSEEREAAIVYSVATGHCLVLADICGWRVCCLSGTLWVTQEGTSQDIGLSDGDWMAVSRPGKTEFYAAEKAQFVLERDKVDTQLSGSCSCAKSS